MSRFWHKRVRDTLAAHGSLELLERDLDRVAGLSDEDRAVLWLFAWSDPRGARRSPSPDRGPGIAADHARRRAPH
jgi:hypothetical protein